MNNNLKRIEKELRSFAKKCKDIKYNTALLFGFLLTGAVSLTKSETENIEQTKKEIETSITDMKKLFREAKTENNKLLKSSNLELIQLMEQGDHVVKSPWSSWQLGENYYYNIWKGTYKGSGDKKQKYPYEGIYARSNDLFLRNISPDSDVYEEYTSSVNEIISNSATTSTIKKVGGSTGYGLASTIPNQEPIASIELGTSVRPKNISKSPVTVIPPVITVNTITPLSTPTPPGAPELPRIHIGNFDPLAPEGIEVTLPNPPIFNIKLGSFCNNMRDCGGGVGKKTNGGGHSGTPRSYDHVTDAGKTLTNANIGNKTYAVRYAWSTVANFNGALLKIYFDYGQIGSTAATDPGGTIALDSGLFLTIDSIRGTITPDLSDSAVNGAYNTGMFLTGGSRVATLDNATDATIDSKGRINMMGPLVVGYEIQSDAFGSKKREVINSGIISDEIEKSNQTVDTSENRLNGLLKVKQIYEDGSGVYGFSANSANATNEDVLLTLPPFTGSAPLTISRNPDIVDASGNVIAGKEGGYTGYKIGLILTWEDNDNRPDSNYVLTNRGTIDFKGRNSIGIQVFAPTIGGTNAPIVNVKNEGVNSVINMGGVASYGLKISSRIKESSTVANEGTININGDNTLSYDHDNNPATPRIPVYGVNNDSLSSGIAVIEDNNLTVGNSIRAHNDRVKNNGIINVRGGEGNSGMVLILKANDNITNEKDINIYNTKNIGMRVDFGQSNTDDNSARLLPTAINKGNISITDGEQNIGMVSNNSSTDTVSVNNETVMKHRAVAINETAGNILFNNVSKKAIGMFAKKGGEIINKGNIKGGSTALEETIGMVIQPASGTQVANGTNSGTIELKGKKVTGVYNQGKFAMTDGSILTSGEKSISIYANNGSTTKISKGIVAAENGALGLFADDTVIELGANSGSDAPVLKGNGIGTLLFYNYTKNGTTYNFSGKFQLNQNVNSNLTNGASAFYYKDLSTSTLISQKLNDMFAHTTGSAAGKKLKLSLDDNSTLFVLENTTPSPTTINLSDSNPSNINGYLGGRLEIDSNSKGYKAFQVIRGRLNVDEDVNLDNHTGSTKSDYYRVEFLNSAVTVAAGKTISGTDAGKLKQIIAQANYEGASGTSNIDVINNGTIDYSKKGATAIVVDFGQATNNHIIKMDASNGIGENSIGLFGSSGSKLVNSPTGEIQLGTRGVGIWGANKIDSSPVSWSKNIEITNNGKITGLSGKEGVFGIYAVNDTTNYSTAASNITHGTTGNIDLSQSKKSIGIYMTNGTLTSLGNMSVNSESVGLDATNSDVTVNSGIHTIGEKSVGFKLTDINASRKFLGNSGNISVSGAGSVVYLLKNVDFTSGNNFADNLALTSTDAYTYINAENSTLNYINTRTINNDDSIFMNAKNSTVNLLSGTDITSGNQKVTGIYAEGSMITNAGTLTLTGDRVSAIYSKDGSVVNNASGKITISKDGSGMYIVGSSAGVTGNNYGEIVIGEGSVGMRAENAGITNQQNGKITGSGIKALGMSQSGGTQNIENKGAIILTGDKSIALHSEGITAANHKVINTGDITVGDSSDVLNPAIGIYSANRINSTVESIGKVTAGNKSTGIYAGNINLIGNSETKAGNGGIAVYSKEGTVNISENSKVIVGSTLGNGQEGVGVYLAGNNQILNSDTDNLSIGKGSIAYVMTGQGNNVRTGKLGTAQVVTLSNDSMFIYSADKTGSMINYNHLKSTGNENYGIYALGSVENYGNINFSQGAGNVGAYSYVEGATVTPNAIRNYATINVSKSDLSDSDNRKYGIGMAAGFGEEVPLGSGNYVVKGLGNIENHGTIKVTDPDSIGMYATGKGSRIYNNGRIELSGSKRNIGIFAENGAEVINDVNGVITTVGSGNSGQIGIALRKGAILDNRGTIHIDASRGYGLFLAGAIIKNYGTANITVDNGAVAVKELSASNTSKEMEDMPDGMNKIKIHSPVGAIDAKIIANGVVQTPTVVHVQAIPNRNPNDIPTSSVGMYVDTSGINYTKPITNLGALAGLSQADIIIGSEATKYTNSKYIQLGQDIIEPYNDMIRTSGIGKWNIYGGSLTWMASITQLPDYTIRNAYLAKILYTVWAGRMSTPVDRKDTYNFLDGLEQRYGVEAIGTRENQLFQKLNSIGNNEEILFFQAIDEMMGHQYANVQQRTYGTGRLIDKEITHFSKEWDTKSKQSNKIKAFGMRDEYKTDTAGIIDYTSNAYGFAYLHEDETVKLGNSSGWYAGAVHNRFKFKDIGKSKENQTMLKLGIFRTFSPAADHNGSLRWTISGEGYVSRNDMHRKYLVVDEIFNAKSDYTTYGVAVKNELGYNIRTSERTSIRPYGSLKLEYGRFTTIKEKSGEMRLDVKGNDYYSIRPEVGVEFSYRQPMAVKTTFVTTLGLGYENELGKVGNVKNMAKVSYTDADWFNIRGEKDDRKGNFKADLNIGIENQRFGVTLNGGYDTKGKNVRGGIGFRAIY